MLSRLVATVFVFLVVAGAARVWDAAEGGRFESRARAHGRVEAVDAGLAWLLEHEDALPPGWTAHVFYHLYRIVPDDRRAARIWSIVQAQQGPGKRLPLPDLEHPRYLQEAQLGRALLELLRRKRLGESYADQVAQIQRLLDTSQEALWARVPDHRRLIFLYFFDELGIKAAPTFAGTVRAVREQGDAAPPESLPADREYMLALTHVVLCDSGYFERYVDPGEVAFVIPHFRRALRYYLDAPRTDYYLDVEAEILICWRLLQLPDDRLIAAARADLVDRQNPDGSWGSDEATEPQRAHSTYSAVLALVDYPAQFRRPGNAARGE